MEGLGIKIKKAREEWNFSQSDMANAIPMNQSNYSKIERDLQEPNMEQLRKICEILKLDCNYLLGIEEYEDVSGKDLQLLKEIKEIIKKYK